jgi:ferric-dicitrate binding protein FerR (iron transport regulator)
MLNSRLDHLFWLCMANKATAAEREELMLLMADHCNEEQVNRLLEQAWEKEQHSDPVFDPETSEVLLNNILSSTQPEPQIKNLWSGKLKRILFAAASVIVFIAAALFFRMQIFRKHSFIVHARGAKCHIMPGSDKATLILNDGSKIELDNVPAEDLAIQNGVKISKTACGLLVYKSGHSQPARCKILSYNTLQTPRGGQYKVVLADGTKIWLNSASSLRYPAAFTGAERLVELSGEAYFEVAHNKRRPFRVLSKHQLIEVLGTHFNVNCYADEAKTKTTLIEGMVKVADRDAKGIAVLRPGQQSVISTDSHTILVKNINTEDAIAWKNGYFMFPNESVTTIMREISRWYNVDIEYRGKIPHKTIWGSISRFKNVAETLRMLELTGCAHFKIKERRIIVTP